MKHSFVCLFLVIAACSDEPTASLGQDSKEHLYLDTAQTDSQVYQDFSGQDTFVVEAESDLPPVEDLAISGPDPDTGIAEIQAEDAPVASDLETYTPSDTPAVEDAAEPQDVLGPLDTYVPDTYVQDTYVPPTPDTYVSPDPGMEDLAQTVDTDVPVDLDAVNETAGQKDTAIDIDPDVSVSSCTIDEDCVDGKACTFDSCDTAAGICKHELACTPSTACATVYCGADGQCLEKIEPPANDNLCVTLVCDPTTGWYLEPLHKNCVFWRDSAPDGCEGPALQNFFAGVLAVWARDSNDPTKIDHTAFGRYHMEIKQGNPDRKAILKGSSPGFPGELENLELWASAIDNNEELDLITNPNGTTYNTVMTDSVLDASITLSYGAPPVFYGIATIRLSTEQPCDLIGVGDGLINSSPYGSVGDYFIFYENE